jgi:hypothetical protein
MTQAGKTWTLFGWMVIGVLGILIAGTTIGTIGAITAAAVFWIGIGIVWTLDWF